MDPQQVPSLGEPWDGEPWDQAWPGQHRRLEPRLPLGSVLPVGLGLAGDGGRQHQWLVADVLDISLGGMALVIDQSPALERDQPVTLDVSAHPDFACAAIPAVLRWFEVTPLVITLGVQFGQPLRRLPELSQRRK